jgi:hypothetical protein
MPLIHFLPVANRALPTGLSLLLFEISRRTHSPTPPPPEGMYRCPVYKILSRAGVLSTTGHSTNFVLWIDIPTDRACASRGSLVSETNLQVQICDSEYWVKAGVAAFCALRY